MALLGGYYAATDGVLAALASGILPSAPRGSGLALLATATAAPGCCRPSRSLNLVSIG